MQSTVMIYPQCFIGSLELIPIRKCILWKARYAKHRNKTNQNTYMETTFALYGDQVIRDLKLIQIK